MAGPAGAAAGALLEGQQVGVRALAVRAAVHRPLGRAGGARAQRAAVSLDGAGGGGAIRQVLKFDAVE